MVFRNLLYFTVFALLIILVSSCIKREEYPETPYIEFLDFAKIRNTAGIDSAGVLKLSFTDGDGDIGLAPGDTFAPFNKESEFYNNFFIRYFEKQKGVVTEVVLPTPNNSRIPLLTPKGQNKALKGEIEIGLFINNPYSLYDTILFEAYILDRALNKSNVITTPEIILKK